MKRNLVLTVLDKRGGEWVFPFRGDPSHIPDWREAGLVVEQSHATIPRWVAAAGLAQPWAALQASWQWLRCW